MQVSAGQIAKATDAGEIKRALIGGVRHYSERELYRWWESRNQTAPRRARQKVVAR
ncbi:hypothetical protein ABQE57_16995 [Mycolicibacterium elephantis]